MCVCVCVCVCVRMCVRWRQTCCLTMPTSYETAQAVASVVKYEVTSCLVTATKISLCSRFTELPSCHLFSTSILNGKQFCMAHLSRFRVIIVFLCKSLFWNCIFWLQINSESLEKNILLTRHCIWIPASSIVDSTCGSFLQLMLTSSETWINMFSYW